jgi:hypothetical protein
MLPFGRYRVKAKEVEGQVEVAIEDSVVFGTFGVDLLLVGRVFFRWLEEGREFYLLRLLLRFRVFDSSLVVYV